MSILQKLWYTNIHPNEDREISENEKKLIEIICMHQNKLLSSLKNNELDTFKKYVEFLREYASLLSANRLKLVSS